MDDRTDDTRLPTDRQISQRYGLSFHTLRKLRVRGGGPPFIKIGRAVRYRSSDIVDRRATAAAVRTDDAYGHRPRHLTCVFAV